MTNLVIVDSWIDESGAEHDDSVEIPAETWDRITAKVRAGAEYLDSVDWYAIIGAAEFNWRSAVKIQKLDMGDPCLCVLGWIGNYAEPWLYDFPLSYHQMVRVLGISESVTSLGLTCSRTMNIYDEFAALTVAWRQELSR